MTIDWTTLTDDPLDDGVRKKIQRFLGSISAVSNSSLIQYFADCAAGQEVLHIGCCEHAEKYMVAEGWKHRRMAEVARAIVGFDINGPGILAMRAMGYEVVCGDATTALDLGTRFDRIVIGDVIEHVGDQQGLLNFASRHLKPAGQLIVSTPNPFFVQHVMRAWFARPMIANFEHVSWVTESNMLELARRCGLTLRAIHYPVGRASESRTKSLIKRASYRIFGTALFTSNIYVLAIQPGA